MRLHSKGLGSRYDAVLAILRKMEHVAVAFSGGVDSSLLLAAARDALGERAVAVTIKSPFHPESETQMAIEIGKILGVRHLIIEFNELANDLIGQNSAERCYYCKHSVFSRLLSFFDQENSIQIVEGSNSDDDPDDRPGMRAVVELMIRSPLREAGLTKRMIRRLAHRMNLPNWNLPANACLATRIPMGEPITHEKLRRINTAETILHQMGFGDIRVRDHGKIARIEAPGKRIRQLMTHRKSISSALKNLGYSFVTIDLSGYDPSARIGVSGKGHQEGT